MSIVNDHKWVNTINDYSIQYVCHTDSNGETKPSDNHLFYPDGDPDGDSSSVHNESLCGIGFTLDDEICTWAEMECLQDEDEVTCLKCLEFIRNCKLILKK